MRPADVSFSVGNADSGPRLCAGPQGRWQYHDASPDNVQGLDSEITRSAPFYSDLREKHVAVKGLGKGDTIEFAAHWRSTKPLIPGQFWFHYNFQHEGIVLDERVEVKVPAGRAVKVKGPQATQTVTTDATSRTYL